MSTTLRLDPHAGEPEKNGALQDVIPFVFLESEKRQQVESKLVYRIFEPGEVVIQKGDGGDDAGSGPPLMYIAVSGGFVCYDEDGYVLTDAVMEAGSYFGERAAIFGTPRTVQIRAMSGRAGSSAWALDGGVILDLLASHDARRFALSLASDLRYKQGIFDAFLGFQAVAFSILHGSRGDRGSGGSRALDLPTLLSRYAGLKSALHTLVDRPRLVDYDAWSYALRRLPRNITTVYSIVCSRKPISVLALRNGNGGVWDDAEFIDSALSPGRPVGTDERRRTCWEVMPGKVFILLRELASDYLDVLTCFCVHVVESKKLRKKLQPLGVILPTLKDGLGRMETAASAEERRRIEDEVLTQVCRRNLEERDFDGLKKLWPAGEVVPRVLELLIHHGDFSFALDSTSNAYNATAEERWCKRVISSARKLMGPYENVPESDLIVDIVSSNTHSVLNCLSPYIHSHREDIIAWGRKNQPALFNEKIENETDRLYALAKTYFDSNPDERAKANAMCQEVGIEAIHEQGLTGISVQLYNLNKLKAAGYGFDDLLSGEDAGAIADGKRHLLINIDYAFGSQGEKILRLLLLSFGKFVRSINVVGKAGGLAPGCKRGDILFPTHILDENQNGEIRSVENIDISPEDLSMASNRQVFVGPVITVLGTILQSRELLLFYERFWHATGMEMEASWYLRAIEEASNLGLLPLMCRTRFLYYVSDTPLKTESSLAARMSILEGVPPLYAITRIILQKVLVVNDVEPATDASSDGVNSGGPDGGRKEKKSGAELWADLRNVVMAGSVGSRPTRTVVRENFKPAQFNGA